MPHIEVPLVGGNAAGEVVRVGSTVRKPWLGSTPSVQRFMAHLRDQGLADVPRPLGRDAQGRQVTEFVPGAPAPHDRPLPLEELEDVGRRIRRIHDAAESFERSPQDSWSTLIPVPHANLICHNDLAPWNLVAGEHLAFIDWDGAGPSTRPWDLAYAAQSFAFLVAGEDPGQRRRDCGRWSSTATGPTPTCAPNCPMPWGSAPRPCTISSAMPIAGTFSRGAGCSSAGTAGTGRAPPGSRVKTTPDGQRP